MLSVTRAALDHLNQIRSPNDSSRILRLAATHEGLALELDEPKLGDKILSHDNQPVLLVDAAVSSAVDSQTLDLRQSGGSPQLTLRSL